MHHCKNITFIVPLKILKTNNHDAVVIKKLCFTELNHEM